MINGMNREELENAILGGMRSQARACGWYAVLMYDVVDNVQFLLIEDHRMARSMACCVYLVGWYKPFESLSLFVSSHRAADAVFDLADPTCFERAFAHFHNIYYDRPPGFRAWCRQVKLWVLTKFVRAVIWYKSRNKQYLGEYSYHGRNGTIV